MMTSFMHSPDLASDEGFLWMSVKGNRGSGACSGRGGPFKGVLDGRTGPFGFGKAPGTWTDTPILRCLTAFLLCSVLQVCLLVI